MTNWFVLPAALWLGAAAWQDARTKEVSNWLTVPSLFLAVGYRGLHGAWSLLLLLAALIGVTELADRFGLPAAGAVGLGVAVAGGLAYHASPTIALVLVVWTCAWAGWLMRFIGGADAKVIMALTGFFPDPRLAGLLAAAHVTWSLFHLVRRYRRQALRVALTRSTVAPTERELSEAGVATMPAYAAAGWLYLLGGLL